MHIELRPHKSYPTDMSDAEWAFMARCLTSGTAVARQRGASLREVFDAPYCIIRSGPLWRLLPTDYPPWEAIHQKA